MERVIVKYNGNLEKYKVIEILSEKFAIIEGEIEKISNDEIIIDFEGIRVLQPMVERGKESSCITLNNENFSGLDGSGVIVGIIDSGITLGHREFENRIIGLWDIPNDRIYNEEEIRNGVNYVDFLGHGTAVAGVACGRSGVASGASIVAVAIGRGNSDDVARGIKYIAELSKERNMPFVINISYGTNFGGHNGQSLIEQYIDEVVENYVCNIVVAAGNEGDKRHHYKGIGSKEVEFNVGESIKSLNLELYKNYIGNLELEIVSPNGNRTGVMTGKDSLYRMVLLNTEVEIEYIKPTPSILDERIIINLSGLNYVDGGIWKIIIRTDENVEYDIWLPISEGVTEDTIFLSSDVNTTITIPSTAYRAISVGAYNDENNTIASFSGRGFTREISYVKPDIVAPGVNIRSASNTGGYDVFTGTSFATPFVTGVCALLMQWGIVEGNDENMYGEKIRALIRRYAIREGNINYPSREWGYGRLCFKNIYNNLNQISATSVGDFALSEDYIGLIVGENDDFLNILKNYSVGVCELDYGNYVIVYVDINTYELLLRNTQIGNGIRSSTPLILGYSGEDFTIPQDLSTVKNLPLDYRGGGVLVGLIGEGIDINASELKYENGESRIYSMWVQDDEINSDGVCFGRVYDRNEITNGEINLRGNTFYTTNMAKAILEVAPDVEFVVVKVKQANTYFKEIIGIDEDALAYCSSDIMLGIDFLATKASIARRPLSIVLGLGTNMGGHDGKTIIETYLENVGINNGVALTTSVGNEALSGRHTSFEINNDLGYRDVEISVDEGVENFTCWIWSNISEQFDISIIPPIGNEIKRIEARSNFINTYNLNLTNTQVKVEYKIPLYRTDSQLTLISVRGAISGVWRIRVYGETRIGKVNCWLSMESFLSGIRFLSPVVSTTITVPSSAEDVISVGAYNPQSNSIIPTSSRGPNRLNDLKPDFVAPSNGATEISAAIVAGIASLLLEWGIVRGNNLNINSISIKSYIIQGCVPINESEVTPNDVWGYGAVNLFNIFNRL